MGFLDVLAWGGITLALGGSVGAGSAKLAAYYLKEQDKMKVVKVIEGKIPNTLKLDGNLIQVDKFQYKKSNGEVVKVKLADLVKKSSQKASIEEKQSFLSILKSKFRRKK